MSEQSQGAQETFTPRYGFSEWPAIGRALPRVCAGVYAVWDDKQLIYCGMSGRQVEQHAHRSKYGLVTRLEAHWNGRLSGDQFCVYVANRLLIPHLQDEQREQFRSGELTLDMLTRRYIREHFEFQHAISGSSAQAHRLEKHCRQGEVFGQKPLLNPLP